MKIYEFNGLPGSGKSTLCDALHAKLLEKKIKLGHRNDLYRDIYLPKRNRVLIEALFGYQNIGINLRIVLMAFRYGISKSRLKWAWGLILLNHLIQKAIETRLYDILILDEGIVQYLTSIPHDKPFVNRASERKLLNLLSDRFRDHLFTINCNITESVNIARLKSRGNPLSRFDRLDEEDLREKLRVKKKNLSYVIENICFTDLIELNMDHDVTQNLELLIGKIAKSE
jgi:hypothetical protein